MRLLETSGLTKRFGGLTVMNDLDFFIEEGEIKGFLGPNGAGKSTFFNLITGVHTPTSGHIIYGGKDITKAKPHQVAKMGIGRTFQLNPLFGDFTVFENVTAAYHMRPHSTIGQVFFNTKTYQENEKYIAKSADEILEFLGLSMRDKGITVLVVEHNMQILDILDSVTVISFGEKIFEGTPEGMRQDPTVIKTYFGGAV